MQMPVTADERTILEGFLEYQRDALVRKCAGLTDEQLRMHPVPSSNVTLLGLFRHLAGVERWYFQAVINGRFPGGLFEQTDDADEDWNVLTATGAETLAMWNAEVESSRRVASQHPLDAIGTVPSDPDQIAAGTAHPSSGRQYTLRWVLIHMIDEYARHLGHADIVREAIDGAAGE
jgi:hypothetical protein